MSRDEIASELEVNKRNIAEYRKELEAAGYPILSTSGRYGGYALLADALLVSSALQEKEKQSLRETQIYLQSHPEFLSGKLACRSIDKILSNTPLTETHTGFYLTNDNSLISDVLQGYIETMAQAIKEQRCVALVYRSMKDETQKRFRIHPYEILHYKGAYYCIAYSLLAKDYRTYKFSQERMKHCELLDQHFNRDANFDLKQHIGTVGLIKHEIIEVEMEIYHQAAVFSAERSIGLHPIFQWLDDHTLHYKTIFEGKQEAISFILSLGNMVKVIQPLSLQEEIVKQAKDMLELYRKKE